MSGILFTRLRKLEFQAGIKSSAAPKIIRLIASDEEGEAAYREAAEMGLDVGPESDDIFIIRLIAPNSSPAALASERC